MGLVGKLTEWAAHADSNGMSGQARAYRADADVAANGAQAVGLAELDAAKIRSLEAEIAVLKETLAKRT